MFISGQVQENDHLQFISLSVFCNQSNIEPLEYSLYLIFIHATIDHHRQSISGFN